MRYLYVATDNASLENGVTKDIQQERIRLLNEKDGRDGDYVLYWMQEAQRAEYNHALEYAVQRANDLDQRLLVVFGLTEVCRRAYERAVLPRHALPLR